MAGLPHRQQREQQCVHQGAVLLGPRINNYRHSSANFLRMLTSLQETEAPLSSEHVYGDEMQQPRETSTGCQMDGDGDYSVLPRCFLPPAWRLIDHTLVGEIEMWLDRYSCSLQRVVLRGS